MKYDTERRALCAKLIDRAREIKRFNAEFLTDLADQITAVAAELREHAVQELKYPARRRCVVCGKDKPIEQYYAYPLPRGGYMKLCNTCRSRLNKERYLADPERHAARTKAWYAKPGNKEKIAEYQRQYRLAKKAEAKQ